MLRVWSQICVDLIGVWTITKSNNSKPTNMIYPGTLWFNSYFLRKEGKIYGHQISLTKFFQIHMPLKFIHVNAKN